MDGVKPGGQQPTPATPAAALYEFASNCVVWQAGATMQAAAARSRGDKKAAAYAEGQAEALAASARAIQAEMAEKYRALAASAPPGSGLRLGYVLGARPSEASARAEAVVAAGADPGRLYVDIGLPGQSLQAAIKGARPGDTLIVGVPDRLDEQSRERLAAKSVSIMEVCQ